MADPNIEAFLKYINARGIPERFHSLYRDELLGVLLHAGVTSVQNLSPEHLSESVRAAERQLQNRKAVCAALDEFLRHLRQQGAPPLQPPPQSRHAPGHQEEGVPDSARGSSAYPPPGSNEGRRYVRVPCNREVKVSGSLQALRASDISVGGMYIETRQALEAGEILDLEFKLRATDNRVLMLQARVVYIDPGVGVGIDFLEVSREDSRAIRHFIEDVVAGRQF